MISPSFSSEDDSKQALVIGKLKNNVEIKGITLRSFVNLSNEEKEKVRQWRNNKIIKKWMFNSEEISMEKHCAFIESLKDRNDKFYFLVLNKKGDYWGTINIYNLDLRNKRCMWGYFANPEIIGKGMGILLEYIALYLVFHTIKIHYLRCETLANNKNAMRLHTFFGLEAEGIYKDCIYKNNRYHDVVVMSISRKNWSKKKEKIENVINKFFI